MIRTTLRAALAGAVLLLAVPLVATAQEEEPGVESVEFRAVTGPQAEDVPGGTLLVAAYGVVLALLILYVMRIAGLQARINHDLARLERAIAEAGEGSNSSEAETKAKAKAGPSDDAEGDEG